MINVNNIFSPELKSEILQEDLEKLSNSFKLLRETADQVSNEANSTANFLREKLHDTTFRFFSVIDAIDDLVVIKDEHGRWKTLNKFGQKLYGLRPDQFMGKTDLELAELFPNHAEGLHYCNKTDELAWNSNRFHREIESFSVNGPVLHFDMIKTPVFYDNGSRKELIVIGRDVTELKNSQIINKACTDALNNASDNIIIFDNSETIIFCNDHMIHEFEFQNHQVIEGKKIDIISSGYRTDEQIQEIWNTIRNNMPWHGFSRLKSFFGDPIDGLVTILPVMNGLPHPAYYICMIKTKNYCSLIKDKKIATCCNRPLDCFLVADDKLPCYLDHHDDK